MVHMCHGQYHGQDGDNGPILESWHNIAQSAHTTDVPDHGPDDIPHHDHPDINTHTPPVSPQSDNDKNYNSDELHNMSNGNTHLPDPDHPAIPGPYTKGPTKSQLADKAKLKTKHTWRYHQVHCIEIITWACGAVVAWAKFPVSESPTKIITMYDTLFQSSDWCPSFMAIDKAYQLLASLAA